MKASLLIALYSVRSDRLFCEMLDYNILFRWFLDMSLEQSGLDQSNFSRLRERLVEQDTARVFFDAVVGQPCKASLQTGYRSAKRETRTSVERASKFDDRDCGHHHRHQPEIRRDREQSEDANEPERAIRRLNRTIQASPSAIARVIAVAPKHRTCCLSIHWRAALPGTTCPLGGLPSRW